MDMQFTEYTYKSFKPEDLIPDEKEILDIKDLRRIDYFNFWGITKKANDKIINDLFTNKYEKDFENDDWKERDFIFFRCIFKEFVIRLKFIDKNVPDLHNTNGVYTRFKIIDSFPDSIVNEKVLLIQLYMLNDYTCENVYSVRIKLTHKDLVFSNIQNTIEYHGGLYNKESDTLRDRNEVIEWIKNLNLYVLPMYVYNKSSNVYERISVLKNRKEYNTIYYIFCSILADLERFNALNYHMLNKIENNDTMDFIKSDNSIVRSSLVEYIKCEAHEDKKIRIRLDNDIKDNDIKLNLYPKNDNIYSHDNKVVRKLCDYRYMVSAHWHHYWVGSKKDGSSHKIRKWVESYEKNKDKPYRIIKEIYKEGGE